MARLLLSCDQSVKCFDGKYYAKNKERYEFFMRYLRVFECLRLAVRCEKEERYNDEWIPLDTEKIEVIDIPDFSGPCQYAKVYFSIGRSISHTLDDCDAAIIRMPSTLGQRVAHKVMKAGIPYAVEVVYDAEDGARNSKSILERILWKRIDRDMRNISYNAFGVSCVTESFLQKHYFSKRPHAFVSNYSSLALDHSFYTSAKLFPKTNQMSIIHVSNQVDCSTRKGHIQILNMLRLLKQKGIKPFVTFVGNDYHNGIALLKKLSEELGVEHQVTFTGGVNRERLSEILESGDIFVFPTAAEGLPRVVIEAMAKGLPCIISNVSGNPELVSPEMLVDYKDVNALTIKVETLIADKAMYEKASKENFNRSWKYEAHILEKRRDEFYNKLKALTIQ